jgi:hypothetical protein
MLHSLPLLIWVSVFCGGIAECFWASQPEFLQFMVTLLLQDMQNEVNMQTWEGRYVEIHNKYSSLCLPSLPCVARESSDITVKFCVFPYETLIFQIAVLLVSASTSLLFYIHYLYTNHFYFLQGYLHVFQ